MVVESEVPFPHGVFSSATFGQRDEAILKIAIHVGCVIGGSP
jgi:hypothetical protein